MLDTTGAGGALVGNYDPGKPTTVRVLRQRGRHGETVRVDQNIVMPFKEAREWESKGWGRIVTSEPEVGEAAAEPAKKARAKKTE